jgi:hypothetical protein
MNGKNQKLLIIVFIAINIIIWSFFIIPKAGSFLSINHKTLALNPETISRKASKEMFERIDFYSLRDPFVVKKANSSRPMEKERPKKTEPVKKTEPPQAVEEKYESRFKLKSIVKLKDKYAAALEESPHYGSQGESGVPYSYRFGNAADDNSSGPKSYLVIEGDSVMGEQVAKISADFVILRKNKKYYKLTFSGGFAVENWP